MIRPAVTLGASCARATARTQLPRSGQQARHASSSAASGASSNLPLILGLGGLAGLGGWYYLGGFQSADKAKKNAVALKDEAESKAKSAADSVKGAAGSAAAAAGSVTGALNKDAFKEFTLKEIKPYNHDSSTSVLPSLLRVP
jgi:cytochrome-b5 reductase